MTLQLKNKAEINKYILDYGVRIEKALIYQLEYLVADLENHAKLSAGYKDRTANLKSSIGGVVLKNGTPISYKGFDGRPVGVKTGNEFINTLIRQFTSGYVLILVAGMDYATFVENYHGLNVLKKSEMRMMSELPKMLNQLKAKL